MSETIPFRLGLKLLVGGIAGNEPASSYIEVRPLEPTGPQAFLGVRELDEVVATVARLQEHHDLVAIGAAPRVRRSGRAEDVERAWMYRADLDSPDSVRRLSNFAPFPNVIAKSRTPGHRHIWWQLSAPVAPQQAREDMRRIAAALGSDPAVADPARVMRAPREFVRLELDAFSRDEIVGRLPPLPPRPAPVERNFDHLADPGAVLAGLAQTVRSAPMGDRNNCLNWAAFKAGGHVADGTLDATAAEGLLLAAALEVGLSEDESERTIHSGLAAGSGDRA